MHVRFNGGEINFEFFFFFCIIGYGVDEIDFSYRFQVLFKHCPFVGRETGGSGGSGEVGWKTYSLFNLVILCSFIPL